MTPQILPLGLDGALIRFGTEMSMDANGRALKLAAKLRAGEHGFTDVQGTLASVAVRFDPNRLTLADVQDIVDGLTVDDAADMARKLWRVPTRYNGDDLQDIADLTGLSPRNVIEAISETPVQVLTIGFAPGQPYLGELPSAFDIPRQTALRQVPAGALVVAIRQMVLFANASPTGWRWVGTTALPLFNPSRRPAALLSAGDMIRFDPVDDDGFRTAQQQPLGGAEWSAL